MEKVKVDLPERVEKRFVVSNQDFIKKLLEIAEEISFSDKKYIQTVYFNNEEYVVPLTSSIKARTYLQGPQEHPTLLYDSEYFIDFKEAKDKYRRIKERVKTNLKDGLKIINKNFKLQVRPFVIVEYFRRHFVPKNGENTRITVDSQLRYFYLTDKKEVIELGKEDYNRIEIKSKEQDNQIALKAEELLKEAGAVSVISKKFMAYNLLRGYIEKNNGNKIYKELPGIEIEAKLELEGEDPFLEIKNLFREKNVSGFILPPHFPFTLVSGSLNRYYQDKKGVFKAMFRGNEARIIRKGKSEIVKDSYNLNCILRREENKGEMIPANSEIFKNSKFLGELYRGRKAFWVDKPETKRTYHISLDRCSSDFGELYELEIEFTGNYSDVKTNSEEEIIEDIAFLTKFILERFPQLKKSQLTKENWLLSK